MKTTGKILYILIFTFLIVEIVNFYSFVENYSEWQYRDWLINYEGGLVRRGFIGHLLYSFHKFFLVDLDKLIFGFVSLIYIFISFYLIKSVRYIENSYENLLIFLSPGFFIYPIMNSGIVGRKDILIIFFVAFFVFCEKKISNKFILPSFILSIIILCLSHSGFVFYTPYLFFLYILIKYKRNFEVKKFEIISIISTIICAVFFIQYFSGSEIIVEKICLSVKEFVSEGCGKFDQIYHIQSSLEYRLVEKINFGKIYLIKYFFVYTLSAFIVFFFLSTTFFNSKFNIEIFNLKNINPFLILLLLFTLTLPVYVIGRDWGRYIYISYSSSFFIYIYCLKEKILVIKEYNLLLIKNLSKISFIVLLFFYSFFLTFPFYDPSSFKITLKKPVKSLIKKITQY